MLKSSSMLIPDLASIWTWLLLMNSCSVSQLQFEHWLWEKYWTYVNRCDSGELVSFHSLYSLCLAPFIHAMGVVTCLANSSSHHHDFAYMWIRYRLCNTYPLLHIYMMKFLGTHSEAAMIGFAWFCHVQVLINDQVIFESIQTEGQYLHCSANFLGRTGQQLHSK